MDIEQLRAKVKALQEANLVEINKAAEVARLEATLKLESSKELFESKVRITANGAQTQKLQTLVNECEAIINSMPVYNNKTRTNRKWSNSHRFGYGTQVDLMYQLAAGILYACAEHKQLLLAHTGLDLEILEQLVEAFGMPKYYDRKHHTVVEARPYTVKLVNDVIDVMQSELGVVINTSKLTEQQFKEEFLSADNVAETAIMKANEAIQDADIEM